MIKNMNLYNEKKSKTNFDRLKDNTSKNYNYNIITSSPTTPSYYSIGSLFLLYITYFFYYKYYNKLNYK